MALEETMRALEKAGTEQNRKVYKRHGITGRKAFINPLEVNHLILLIALHRWQNLNLLQDRQVFIMMFH